MLVSGSWDSSWEVDIYTRRFCYTPDTYLHFQWLGVAQWLKAPSFRAQDKNSVFHLFAAMVQEGQIIFFRRMVDLGLDSLIDVFKAKGYCTYDAFAFASDFTPGASGASDDRMLTPMLLQGVCDGNESLLPALRKLWWESWTHASEDMASRASAGSGTAPRHVLSLIHISEPTRPY